MSFRVIFMGTPKFSIPVLEAIHESEHKLVTVYTQPPKKKFRGKKLLPSPIHQLAERLNIPVRFPNSLDDQEFDFIKSLNPDIVIVVAYGKIIPSKFLNLLKIDFINAHASILPRWRGAAPIQRAIMNMDNETGISIMKVVSELDAGPVMKVAKIKIKEDSNFQEINEKISSLAASTIIESLKILESKKEKFVPQDSTKATYAKKIKKSESKINWNDKAKNIIAKINALYPNPGSWFELNGRRIKVIKAREAIIKGAPGEIISENLIIGCLENSIQILTLKKEGKKEMSVTEFLKGNRIKVGLNVSGT